MAVPMSMNVSPSLTWRLFVRKAFSAPIRYQIFAVAATLIVLFIHIWFIRNAPFSIYDISGAAQNETLGFAKAFYISLPYRSDRQDAMQLLAATSKLMLTYEPGVLGSTMNEKAKNTDGGFLRDEQWGCWRSHADVWRRVVDEKLETALILEDDVDWDSNVHDSFEALSREMRKGKLRQTSMTLQEYESAPYGLDWDVLYVGTCMNIPRDHGSNHVIYKDSNAPGRANMTDTVIGELEGWGVRVKDDTHKRVLAASWYPICTLGYAVTQRGAQRLLYNVGGVKRIGSAVDLAITDQIKKGHLKGYTIIPPLITAWKIGGAQDSDIDDMKAKEGELKPGEKLEVGSKNLWSSARVRMNETLGNQYPGNWE